MGIPHLQRRFEHGKIELPNGELAMKNWILIFVLIGLSACANMTPREKQTAYIVGGILIGAVIISSGDGDKIINKPCHNHGKHHDRHHTCDY